jgi:hypothetical protein
MWIVWKISSGFIHTNTAYTNSSLSWNGEIKIFILGGTSAHWPPLVAAPFQTMIIVSTHTYIYQPSSIKQQK